MGDYNANPNPATDLIRQVAFGYGFAPQKNLKVDQFSTLTGKKGYHLVVKIGSTNLMVLVDPDQLPHS